MEVGSGHVATKEEIDGARQPIAWRDLREWLQQVEAFGQLATVSAKVDPIEELSAITYMATRQENSPALLFENMEGDNTSSRILTNMLGASKERFAIAMGLDPSLSTRDIIAAARNLMRAPIKPIMVPKISAPVNDIVLLGDDIDLTRFPVPKFWPMDGGRFLGSGDATFTMSARSGRLNVGCYRQMLHGRDKVGIYCSPGKHGLLDREEWWARGEPCEVVVAYGIDPLLFMAAAQSISSSESELDFLGGLMGRPFELTQGEVVSLPIPANAEFVIEGLIYPGEYLPEGPLGEFTGYYGREKSPQPVIRVKAVHHRKSPIFTHALMANYPSGENGSFNAIMRSARILDDLERIGVGGVVSAYAHPAAAAGFGLIVVSLQQKHAGHAAQVLALTAQCPAAAYYTKWIIAVDEDVDPTDINQVLWALSTRCHPSDDIDILRQTWSTGLDPSQGQPDARPYGAKALINACKPYRYIDNFPVTTAIRRSIYDKVFARWSELGLKSEAPQIDTFHI